MAANSNRDSSNAPNGDQQVHLREVKLGLERVLKLRELAGMSCTSPTTTASPLAQRLHQLASRASKTSPRNGSCGRGYFSGIRSSCPGLSPSASSDSSGGYLSITGKDAERGTLTSATSINSLSTAASARPLFPMGSSGNRIGARDSESRVIEQPGGGELTTSTPMSTVTTVGRGKNALPASGVGKAPKPKRKRPSRKPPTQNIYVSQEKFLPTVQRLTGLPVAEAILPQPELPQPERPPGNAVPIHVAMVVNPPSRPQSSSVSRMSVPSPSPPVSNKVPEATFSFRDSHGSGSSSLNTCMGFGEALPPFLEASVLLDDDSQPASNYSYSRQPVQGKSHEDGAGAAAVRGGSFKEAAPPASEIVEKREDISRGYRSLGSGIPQNYSKPFPSPFLVPQNRPVDVDYAMEDDDTFDPISFLSMPL